MAIMQKHTDTNIKFSFTIKAGHGRWDVVDLDNISRIEATDIGYIIEKERGINDTSDDTYIGENLYVDGDWESKEIKVSVEKIRLDKHTIDVFVSDHFYVNDPLDKEDLVTVVNQYLSEYEKDNCVSIDCDKSVVNKISNNFNTRYNIMLKVELSIKYWDANIHITFDEETIELYRYENFNLNIDI